MALERQQPGRFSSLLKDLQSSQSPPLKYILTVLINQLLENSQHFLLILDDYHLITEPEVHATLSYLMQHIPPQLHIIISTRADHYLQLTQLRARGLVLEIRTQQLSCTVEEAGAFFQEAMGLQLPDKTIKAVTTQTEGWLVGLKLLAFSLPGHADPATLLEEVSGDQRYILGYLTDEVLQRQPQEVQTFLLSTCLLERLTASLCDAITEQGNSQQILERLERTNLFLTSLDSKQEWYRYHALFAQALRYQLEQTYPDLVPILHARASRWYAQHHQTTQAILSAFRAHQWLWAADLIECEYLPLVSFAWGNGKHALVQLRQWLEQLPADIMACRPRLCLACVHMLWTITPHALLYIWLDLAEVALMASLKIQTPAEVSQASLTPQARQEQMDLLGEAFTLRAFLRSYMADGEVALALCEQALAHLSPENAAFRAIVSLTQFNAYYQSSVNDAMAAIECGHQAVFLTQVARQPAVTLVMIAVTAAPLIGAGRLHEAEQLIQQALLLEMQSGRPQLPEVGWVTIWRAEILREWNELASAQSLMTDAISLCEQAISLALLLHLYLGYAVLGRISLSSGEFDVACSAFQKAEQIGKSMNQQLYQYLHACFITIDQVRLWLACGELDRATHWVEGLDVTKQHLTPFGHERQEVARARILLAKDQPAAALQRLELVLQRATVGQRWGHVIDTKLRPKKPF